MCGNTKIALHAGNTKRSICVVAVFMVFGTIFIALAGLKLLTEYWSIGNGDNPFQCRSDQLLTSTKASKRVTTTLEDSSFSLKVTSKSDADVQNDSSPSPSELPDACCDSSSESESDNMVVEISTPSDTCDDDLQATSGVTDDSGYVGTSDKLINSHISGDSFIADDEPKDSQLVAKEHVDDPKPTSSTSDIMH